MTPEAILKHTATVLSREQRLHFFEQGFVHLDSFLEPTVTEELQQAFASLIERYKHRAKSTDDVLIEHDHTPDTPRFKRINRVTDQHPGQCGISATE